MKAQSTLQILSHCCLLGLFSLTAHAATLPEKGPIPFTLYDQNGNGTISQQEFDSTHAQHRAQGIPSHTPPSFKAFDLNQDGKLTKEELHAGQRQKMQQHHAQIRQQTNKRPPEKPSFSEFDLNGNGFISKEEFYEARTKRRIEKARQGHDMANIRHAKPFEKIDLNGDQKITADEFSNHLARYHK